jgi:hypothetical protein
MTIPPRPVGLLHLGPTRTPGQSELSIQVDHVRALNLKLCDIKERLRRAAVARDIALRDGMV